MDLFHLNIATRGREPLQLDPRARRVLLGTLCRVAGRRLWLFGAADDHVHALVRAANPGVLAGHLSLAIEALPGAPRLQKAYIEPVTTRSHLRTLVSYVVNQSEHHNLGPTATWEGSCFRDLVGARRLEGFDPRAWREGLPREDSSLVWAAVGLQRPALVPLGRVPLDEIVASASRVTGADPGLDGRELAVMRGRRLAAALAREAAYAPAAVMAAIGCSERTHRRLVADGADSADLAAARLDLAIELAAAGGFTRAR